MPITFVSLLVYIVAIIIGFIGVTRKRKSLKIISAILFLIGVTLTVVLIIATKRM